MKLRMLFVALLLAPNLASATGRYECEPVDPADWLTQEQLTEKLTEQGWQVDRMKKDGGCWEVYGTMPDGLRVEGYFHPASGEKLFVSQRGRVIFRATE